MDGKKAKRTYAIKESSEEGETGSGGPRPAGRILWRMVFPEISLKQRKISRGISQEGAGNMEKNGSDGIRIDGPKGTDFAFSN